MEIARLLAVALVATAAGCSVELEHALDERQANEVVAVLDRAGIPADKVADEAPGAFTVVVARGDAAQAFRVLEAHALPRRAAKGVGEAFADKGLLPSATAERARLQASLGADLERTLEALPGVTAARVHLALPEDDPLHATAARPRPTASVLLRARRGAAPAEGDVRRIVAGAVEGMQAADVSVVVAVEEEVQPAPEVAQVGPLRVARGSRGLALGLAVGALALVFALSLVLVAGAFRMRALRARLRQRDE